MLASYDEIEPEKCDIVRAGFNTDNNVEVGTCYHIVVIVFFIE